MGTKSSKKRVKPSLLKRSLWVALPIFIGIVTGMIVLNPISLRFLAKSLVVASDPIRPADVIIVLAGDLGDREATGAKLWKEGLAPVVIMSGGGTFFGKPQTQFMKDYAVTLGVPANRILCEDKALSTIENARFSIKMMRDHSFRSAIVVTDAYHTSRSKYCFDRTAAPNEFDIQYYASDDRIDYDNWYTDYEMAQEIVTEFAKIVLYRIKF